MGHQTPPVVHYPRARTTLIFASIRKVSQELSSEIFALNGVEDHVHVAVSIPPSLAVAQWVKRCKGASSYMVNQTFPEDEPFGWQEGYGVLTFGQRQLEIVVRYVQNQKVHHLEGGLHRYLEQLE